MGKKPGSPRARTAPPQPSGLPYQPDRGHFIYLNFDPQAGTEQAGLRPALVLSPLRYNVATGLAFVCPLTNQVKGSPFEVALPPALKVTGVILANQLRSLDWVKRQARFHSVAPAALVDSVWAIVEAICNPT